MRFRNTFFIRQLWQLAALLWFAASVHAQQPANQAASQDEARAAVANAAREAMISGPQTVQLLKQAVFALPENYGFIPQPQAGKLMEMWGNTVGDEFIGLVVPLHSDSHWFAAVDYINSGFIKDDDAKDWNADELLDNLKEGTEAGNERRARLGIPPLKVTRWVEAPQYNADVHHLVWSAEIRLKEGEDKDPGVNYNTYVLGREGYISLNLVTSLSDVEADKRAAKTLLTAIKFNDGKSYGEFDASTDKVAAYGLAALVGGLALKKLGLLAVIGAFLAKFFKVILVAGAAAGGWFSRFFKRKPAAEVATSASPPPAIPAPRDPDKDPD